MILHPQPTLEFTYFKIDLGKKKRGSVPGANKHHMDYIKGFCPPSPYIIELFLTYFKKGLGNKSLEKKPGAWVKKGQIKTGKGFRYIIYLFQKLLE